MNHKFTKATICAVTAAMIITGNGFCVEAATGVKASLPAAGLSLALGEGSSIGEVRDGVKQKKEEQKKQNGSAEAEETATETKTSSETAAASADKKQEKEESETESVETEEDAEIVEAVDPVLDEEEETEEKDVRETEEKKESGQKEEKETLIIAQVNDYVNIRSIPSTDGEIVGKLYNNSVGVLVKEEGDWYQMKSGNVEGYVKAEYFETGDKAKRIADEVGDRIATVNTETLRVRMEASLDAGVLGLVPGGEELTVLAEENGFVKVSIEEGDGWVSMDYVDLRTEYVTAESIEEERARLEKEQKAREEAKKAAEAAKKKLREEQQKEEEKRAKEQEQPAGEEPATEEISVPVISSDTSLGTAVANYAQQFVGNPYVYGGTSLTHGADCSGFVMSVYKNFGVSLPHSSSADRHVGYAVGSLAEAQPGDVVCYSGHVGIYIGGGQIVHASTEATGIKISNASYRKILAIRRIF